MLLLLGGRQAGLNAGQQASGGIQRHPAAVPKCRLMHALAWTRAASSPACWAPCLQT